MNNPKGKSVVVVGASSGIGAAVAKEWAKQGVRLCLAARRKELLDWVSSECYKLGAEEVLVVQTDVTVKSDCQDLVNEVISEFGSINLFIYSAGQAMHSLFEEITDLKAVSDAMFEVNFYGAVYCTHYALPHLQRENGHFVVISSLAGIVSPPFVSLYTAAKHAVHGFYEALINEEPGIDVTIICAGYVSTELDDKKVGPDGYVQPVELNTDKSKYMTAEKAAKMIVKATKQKKKVKYLSSLSSMAVTMQAIVPGFINSKVKQEMNKITDVDSKKKKKGQE
jgi:short-subunit dehydrogenase